MAEIQQITQPIAPKRAGAFKRFLRWVVFIAFMIGALFFWWKYFYVFGEGVKSGELNYVVKKGNIFKTYEGKLIQSGFRSKAAGTVQSYEFEFSVTNDSIANLLMNNSGKYFDLHYKEYKGTIPWRGYSVYVVDKIILMKDIDR
ncbi:hypothetical protein LK994_01950 [Ferruginibacter lapsinanis]|uniref:hypothetical protein n=1 Tax=Ferruginibacter lapsinanis TaxID=563172 RepID=UPI001E50B68A|nr:hypothetical protein [Ferruginibacter lapsinanis]UEG50237.1 hypothetical protein LK994_01950 [Ferruginibacter lapsinanis]